MKITFARLGACAILASIASIASANDIYFGPDFTGASFVWDVQVDGGPVLANPTIFLLRGRSYNLHVSGLGLHTFYVNDSPGTGATHAYTGTGLSANGIDQDTGSSPITFDVPWDAPDTLYYDCGVHASMEGTIMIDGVFTNGFEGF